MHPPSWGRSLTCCRLQVKTCSGFNIFRYNLFRYFLKIRLNALTQTKVHSEQQSEMENLLAMLADTEEENMEEEKEKEEGSTVRPVVLPNGVVVQYGGAGRKRKAGGSVSEGFKATTGYNNKTQRLRFIKEDRRSLTSRITSSSAKSGVLSELIKKVDGDALLSGNDRKECIRKMFSGVSKQQRVELVGLLGSNNNIEQRFKHLVDTFFPDVDGELGELEILVTTMRKLSLRSMEEVMVNLFSDGKREHKLD